LRSGLGRESPEALPYDWNYAILGWKTLVQTKLDTDANHSCLTKACLKKGGYAVAREEWKQLAQKYPTSKQLARAYNEVTALSYLDAKDWKRAVTALKLLVIDFPD